MRPQFQCNSPATLQYISAYNRASSTHQIHEWNAQFDGPIYMLPGGEVRAGIGAQLRSWNYRDQSSTTIGTHSAALVARPPVGGLRATDPGGLRAIERARVQRDERSPADPAPGGWKARIATTIMTMPAPYGVQRLGANTLRASGSPSAPPGVSPFARRRQTISWQPSRTSASTTCAAAPPAILCVLVPSGLRRLFRVPPARVWSPRTGELHRRRRTGVPRRP